MQSKSTVSRGRKKIPIKWTRIVQVQDDDGKNMEIVELAKDKETLV